MDVEVIKDLERTEIPFLKKKIFDAESLIMHADNKNVILQAKKDVDEYRKQLRSYEQQVSEARRKGLI